jgi:hypothetical protein
MIRSYLAESGDYIMLGLPRLSSVDETVALVAEAHREVDLSETTFNEYYLTLETTVETKFTVNSNAGSDQTKILCISDSRMEKVRPRLLAALLRFADELDIDHRRVYMDRLKLMKATSYSHLRWCLCDYVSDVQIENEYITIHYRFPPSYEKDGPHIRELVEAEIESKLTSLKDIFWPNGVKPNISSKPRIEYSDVVKILPNDVEIIADEEYIKLVQNRSYGLIEDQSRILPITKPFGLEN